MSERRAVVIGASMAGLLAARALAPLADHVLVVERDNLPGESAERRGVPHARHAHGLLPAGELILRDYFPGLMEDLAAGGAQVLATGEGRWWQLNGYRAPSPGTSKATFCSRHFLETQVRARVGQLASVSFRHASAGGLEYRDGKVTGVLLDGGEVVTADLVVDCSGRGSRATQWLSGLGYPVPHTDRVTIDMRYASCTFRRTPGRTVDGTWFVTISDPARSKRLGVAFPIEGDRWIISLAGFHGDQAPADAAGFLSWARTLPTASIANLIEAHEPAGPIVTHRLPSNQWRHFERLRRHPRGFVAAGDAMCSFNPVYGQGMSSAAGQAVALGAAVAKHGLDGAQLPRTFYKAAAKVIAHPWAIATGADFVFPETTGPKPFITGALSWYISRVMVAAQHDKVVAGQLWQVQSLLAPPPSLLKPALMRRVLRP